MFNKKIRAWHIELKQMYKVTLLDLGNEVIHCIPLIGDKYSSEAIFSIHEVSLEQDSGLTDELGFSVFKKDIVDFEGTNCVVEYGHYGNSLSGCNGFGWYLDGKDFNFPYMGGAKIVGNSYINPEIKIGVVNGN
jgi:hypothetical protein